jgi:hypothetical protein
MRTLIRSLSTVLAPALFGLALLSLAPTDAASAPPDAGNSEVRSDAASDVPSDARDARDGRDARSDASPDVMLDAALPDAKAPPYPFDAGKPRDAHPILDAPADVPGPIPPDPNPLLADAVFVLSVKYDKGNVSLDKTRREKLPMKAAVDRRFGRFAAELYSGPTLVERIRFDFPLINDDSKTGEAFEKGLTVAVDVKIPDSPRPNKLEIWDRATDKRWSFPYPPK